MAQHALLSPSAAHRWMNCPAAPRLEAKVEDKGSSYALEGTLAHAYCALKIKQYLGAPADDEEAEIATLHEQFYAGEMDEFTDTYKTLVLEKYNAARAKTADAELLIETRLDFGSYIPDAFGTADAIIIADGTMEVIDFKYGKGVRVEAVMNPQMMIYALGAYELFSFDYNIKDVRMTIVQPRLDNLSEFEMSAAELLEWAKGKLAPAAKEAYRVGAEQHPGEWCQFCRVKNNCKALAGQCVAVAEDYNGKTLSADELAKDVLPKLAMVKTWLAGVEDYALQQALSGVHLDGWKLVEGRSNRKITDVDGAVKALCGAGYEEAQILKPKELKTITELEKLCGKKAFASICAGCVEKPQGKPALVPENDKRPAFVPILDDFKDIEV